MKSMVLKAGLIMAFALLALAACSGKNEPNGSAAASLQSDPASPPPSLSGMPSNSVASSASSLTPSDSIYIESQAPLLQTPESYPLLVADIIEQYRNNSIEVGDMFPALPDDFEFPQALTDFVFWQDEMGYYTTMIHDKNNFYEMYISIDDTIYDGIKPEENPHVFMVSFNKIASPDGDA